MEFPERIPQRPGFGDIDSSDCVATPDGGFLYIGTHCVTFIRAPKDEAKQPLIKMCITKQTVNAIDVDPKWSNEEKFFAMLTADHSVLIWDLDKNVAISGHRAHCALKSVEGDKGKARSTPVHISFMKNRNLLSLSAGELVVYCVASNSTWMRSNFFHLRGYITVLKCSPYDEHIFAFGTNKGTVIVCDLQKSHVLHTFNSHKSPIVCLAWNAVELETKEKKLLKSAAVTSPPENDDIFNIYDYDYLENEFGAPTNASNINEDECHQETSELSMNPNFDFTEACENLKQEITALNENMNKMDVSNSCNAVTLADCQQTNMTCKTSEVGSNESTEGSLELVEQNSSSDDSCHVDGMDVSLTEEDKKLIPEKMICDLEQSHVKHTKEVKYNERANIDILLASANNDGQFFIWNVNTGNCCDQFKSAKGSYKCKIFWINTLELLYLNLNNELIRLQLSEKRFTSTDKVRQYKLVNSKNEPSNVIASKVVKIALKRDNDYLWCITTNRKIVFMNIKTGETLIDSDTVTNSINTMSECPHNNLKIAFALANTSIGLMDAQQLSKNKTSFNFIYPRLSMSVKVLAWHANGEDLAYGTFQGNVGVVNVESQAHTTFRSISSRPVYAMAWRGDQLFFTCNDQVFAHKVEFRDPLQLEGFTGPYSYLAVYQTFLLLGKKRGHLEIYRERTTVHTTPQCLSFELIQIVEVAKHYITDISFNPIKTEQFAIVANEAYVYLLNFNAATGTAEITHKLDCGAPKAEIYKAKWSNRDANKLITCGIEGGVRLFDLSRQNNEYLVFVKIFHCPLFSVMFLPTNERYVLCTGKTITIEVVDTEQTIMEINNSKSYSSLDGIKWATQSNINQSAGSSNRRKRDKILTTALAATEAENQKAIADQLITGVDRMEIVEKPTKKEEPQHMPTFLKKPATILILLARDQNKNPLLKINEFITLKTFKEKRSAVLIAKLFGEKIDAEKLLAAELANLKSTGASAPEISTVFLNQLNGGLKKHILNAIQTRQLNEWHISLAPSISYCFWQKCCQAFAEQLIEQGYALQAASFLLGLHKEFDAIEILLTANYFKEAMLLGRIYLHESDPLLNDITDKWINHLESQGNLSAAALICTCAKQFHRGYEILSKQRVATPEVQAAIVLLKEVSFK